MAKRRRRRGHLIPWGPRRRGGGSVDPGRPGDTSDWPSDPPGWPGDPERWLGDPEGWPGNRPGGHSPDSGGAGVREPRRPKPTLPGVSAAAEPEPDTYLDISGAR